MGSAMIPAMDSSTWLSGWIGGLLAAAVTISATIWWEARARRRRSLDQAVDELARSSLTFMLRTIEIHQARHKGANLGEVLAGVGRDQQLVQAFALRRVWIIPAQLVAPARAGLAPTIEALWTNLNLALDRFLEAHENHAAQEGWDQALSDLSDAASAHRAACLKWISSPWSYWPNRDLSPEILKRFD